MECGLPQFDDEMMMMMMMTIANKTIMKAQFGTKSIFTYFVPISIANTRGKSTSFFFGSHQT